MAAWVSTALVQAPLNATILARFGSNWVFCAFSRFGGWKLVGGTQEKIAEPPEWWCKNADPGQVTSALRTPQEGHALRRSKAPVQLSLSLASTDSVPLSRSGGEEVA